MLEHEFLELGLPEIVSLTAKINARSRWMMEKIGLKYNESRDFNHPKSSEINPLYEHIICRISKDKYKK